MEKKEQFEILLRVLRRFQKAGVLDELILIGSWCLYFYRFHFQDTPSIPPVRTMDVDFLIPHISRIRKEIDIPVILKEEGFLPVFNRSNGIVKYNHPDLLVEFLLPELGKGGERAREIKNLHIKAVALRYLNLLLDHPLSVKYEGLEVRVPDPAVFALHKLIVSSRRAKAEKRAKDLEAAIGLLDFLWDRPGEIERMKKIVGSMPQTWRTLIRSVADKHYPPVSQMIKSVETGLR